MAGMAGLIESIIVVKEGSTVRMPMDGGGNHLTLNPQVQLQHPIVNLYLMLV